MDRLGIECQLITGVARGASSELTLGFVKKQFGLK